MHTLDRIGVRHSNQGLAATVVAWIAGLALVSSAHGQVAKCCLPDGRGCRDVTQSQCDLFGGVFVPGQLCANPDDTCDAPLSGACCFAAGCQVVLSTQCPGGTLFEPNGVCPSTTCNPPTPGACCRGLVCEITSAQLCTDGIFTPGVGACSTNFCGVPPTGACCSQGSCSILTRDECFQAADAEWFQDQECTTNLCRKGACCMGPRSCVITTQQGCEAGFWIADGVCDAPFFCSSQAGSCCRDSGVCVVTSEIDCTNGTWIGDGTCAARVCTPMLGACCNGGAVCTVTGQSSCFGTFFLDQACSPVNTCCPADVSLDDDVTVNDLFVFLADWFTNNGTSGTGILSDFDRSGTVSINDLFVFLAAWFAGCP